MLLPLFHIKYDGLKCKLFQVCYPKSS